MNLIIFGPPAAGKGTQSDLIAQDFELKKISTGDLLRLEISKKTDLSNKIKSIIDTYKTLEKELSTGNIDKKDFVKKLKEELSSSSSVIVAHYSGITVDETDQLRKEMRNNGAKFKVTKNRLTKLALEDTQFKSLADLFSGPTAIAYSEDPVAPAKVAVSFEKKIENFKIIGGGYDGEKMDNNKINFPSKKI